MLEQATKYLERGFSIIPVGQNKKPLISWLEFQKRYATKEEVISWFKKWPKANIGIITGKISNITVVDIEKGGDTKKFPITTIAKTGGGGWHFYYRYAPNVSNYARILPLTDIRGDGGYVIAPPSIHSSGEAYEWSVEESFAPFPYSILDVKKQPSNWNSIMLGVSGGQRNETAAKVFGKLLRSFNPDQWKTVWQMGIDWNLKNSPPLLEYELRVVFKSICRIELQRRNSQLNKISILNKEKIPESSLKQKVNFVTFSDVLNLGYVELLNTDSKEIISFGYDWLDEQLTGFFPGELLVVGGESGTGKSTFTTNIIYKASKKHKCAIYALEDRLEDYAIKAMYFKMNEIKIAEEGRDTILYDWNSYRRNELNTPEIKLHLQKAKKVLQNSNIFFAQVNTMMNIDLFEELVRKQVKEGVEIFLVDHLHYFDLFSDKNSKADYIERVMIRIRTLQRETGARIILVVHYKKLDGRKPTLDSFKDSISIIQNANYVINMWRDRTAGSRDKQNKFKTTFFIPKSRNPNGEGMVEVMFDPGSGDYLPLGPWKFGTEFSTKDDTVSYIKKVFRK